MSVLKFELDDWIVLKNIFMSINEIIDEIVIKCDDDGLRFNAIDRSKVCFFEVNIPCTSFDEYSINNNLSLEVDVNELVKILKRGNNNDKLFFEANNTDFNIIYKNKGKRSFKIPQLNIEDNSKEYPSLDFLTEFECEYNLIKNTLKDAELYSNELQFQIEKNMLHMKCDGVMGKYCNEYSLMNNIVADCSSKYSIEWLMKIFNNNLKPNNLNIYMGDDFPMLIKILLKDNIEVKYLLAPRLGDDI